MGETTTRTVLGGVTEDAVTYANGYLNGVSQGMSAVAILGHNRAMNLVGIDMDNEMIARFKLSDEQLDLVADAVELLRDENQAVVDKKKESAKRGADKVRLDIIGKFSNP